MSGRVKLECVPVGAIVSGPGAGTLYEVLEHGRMSSTVREVCPVRTQIDFFAHSGTERVRFTARHARAPIRWSGATRVLVEEAGPSFPSPLESVHDKVVARGIVETLEGLRA